MATTHDSGTTGQPLTNQEALSNANDGQTLVVSKRTRISDVNGLIDRGANGTIAGRDMRSCGPISRTVNIAGLQEHTVNGIGIRTMGSYTRTNKGPVIAIYPQAAHMPSDKSIFATLQLEHNGCKVNDKAPQVNNGILPAIEAPGGYRIPIAIRGRLA